MFTPPRSEIYPPVRSLHRKSYPLEACRSVGVRQLTRCIYNIDPKRQRILDSWPVLDDTNARRDWGWGNRYDLAAMTQELLPQIRELLATRADALGPSH